VGSERVRALLSPHRVVVPPEHVRQTGDGDVRSVHRAPTLEERIDDVLKGVPERWPLYAVVS